MIEVGARVKVIADTFTSEGDPEANAHIGQEGVVTESSEFRWLNHSVKLDDGDWTFFSEDELEAIA